MSELTDWRGTPIEVGCHVVYPSRQYSNMWMTEGQVISIADDEITVRKVRSSAEKHLSSRAASQTARPSLARVTVVPL